MIVYILLLSFHLIPIFAITCRDELDESVDWYIAYKLPKIKIFPAGNRYIYASSKSSNEWILSSKDVTKKDSILAMTLAPLYDQPSKYSYVFYNDDPPNKQDNSHLAHAKGVLAMDKITGFFLVHSIPNFSSSQKPYSYPNTGLNNGQLALCISFSTSRQAHNIIKHLLYTRPNIYDSYNQLKITSLYDLINRKWPKGNLTTVNIHSIKGVKFTGFGRSSKHGDDIYSNVIARKYSSDLFVESWRRGAGKPLESNCTRNKIINVKTLQVYINNLHPQWEYNNDHSKWAISTEKSKKLFCITDVNRMKSQFNRGGGALCINNLNIWNLFRNLIVEFEQCKIKKVKKYIRT